MKMSKTATEQSVRPKIFQNWPKNPTKLYQSSAQQKYRESKKKQSLQSQQSLNKSLLILANIKNFLQTKKKVEQNYRVNYQYSNNCRIQLQGLGMQNGKQFKMPQYEQAIKNYYFTIRKQQMYLREAQGFRLSNLANYDKKLTDMRSKRAKGQSHKQLITKIQDLEQKRIKLQEALVCYQQGIQPSQILTNQFQLDSSLDALNQSLSNQKLTQLHYLMLYQINQMNEQYNKFEKYVSDDKENYATYEALCDSMNLMSNQRQQMKKDRKSLQTSFESLKLENAQSVVKTTRQSMPILMKNQAVYQSNIALLARYNAETNLNQYAKRRKKYSSQVSKHREELGKWKQRQQACSYLYSKQEILDSYNKTRAIQTNQKATNKQKQLLKQSYIDTLNCQVPPGANTIQKYKISLIQQFGRTMQREGIMIPEGTKLLVSNMANSVNSDQNEGLQKYFNFFMQLKQQPIKKKVPFLLTQKNNINALQHQLNQNNSNSKLINQYSIGLQYCQAIFYHSTFFQDQEYIERTQQISKNRWTGLPIGFASFLSHYTCDVFIKDQAQKYINDIFEPRMKKIEQAIYDQLQNSGKQKQITQAPQLHINLTPQQRRNFFSKYYHKLSNYSELTKQKILDTYWKTSSLHITTPYQQNSKNNKSNGISQVSKKDFFKFKTLSYLAGSGAQLKLSNFPDTIDYYLDYLNKYEYYRFDQKQMFLQIVKQRIFIQFLKQKITKNNLNLQQQYMVMQKLNQACILLYQINDNSQLLRKDDINEHFQYSIKLQKAQNDLLQNLPKQNSSFLVVKMKNLVKSMRKDPITMGNKLSIDELQLLVNTQGKLKKLQKVNTLKPNFGFICTVYKNTNNALQTIQNLNDHNYTKSDVINLTIDKSKSLYLSQLSKKSKDQLINLKPQFNQIINIFQCGIDRDSQRQPIESQSIKNQSKSQQTLKQIISKLRRLA